jgi:microsomal dipeptidase-like Zn-dependent dipeptidase
MNRIGMIVDVSHVSDDAVRDVLAVSSAPVIASHSCCRALCEMPRNLPDELLRDIAATGGVVGINFYPPFLDEAARDAMLHGAGDLLRLLNEPRARRCRASRRGGSAASRRIPCRGRHPARGHRPPPRPH